MPLFCTNCGKEVFPGENFCSNCGAKAVTEQRSPATTMPLPASQPEAAPRVEPSQPGASTQLDRLFTRNWKGTCPKCGPPSYTVENAQCPVDGSPLVIAFDAPWWNPFAYPIHTAHVRCLNDCGYRSMAIDCTRCIASPIRSRYIQFKMPLWRYILNNGYGLLQFAVFVALCTASILMLGPPTGILIILMVVIGLPAWYMRETGKRVVVFPWLPFRRTFNFDIVERLARKQRGR
jgi:hypothetical protein